MLPNLVLEYHLECCFTFYINVVFFLHVGNMDSPESDHHDSDPDMHVPHKSLLRRMAVDLSPIRQPKQAKPMQLTLDLPSENNPSKPSTKTQTAVSRKHKKRKMHQTRQQQQTQQRRNLQQRSKIHPHSSNTDSTIQESSSEETTDVSVAKKHALQQILFWSSSDRC